MIILQQLCNHSNTTICCNGKELRDSNNIIIVLLAPELIRYIVPTWQ